jgi:tetratricopeptide (TPR) repeat protein
MERRSAFGTPESGSEVHEIMRKADQYNRDRNYPEALELCSQILSKKPDFFPALLLSATVTLKLGNTTEAEKMLIAILKVHPDSFPTLLWLGTLYARNGRHREASMIARKAIQIQPKDKDAHLLLSKSLFEEEKLEEAELALRQTLLLSSENPEVHALIGTVLQQNGKLQEAEVHLRKAIDLNPTYGPPYYDLALCRKMTDDDQRLLTSFERALSNDALQPRDAARIHYALGKSYNDLGQYEKAMNHYDQANGFELRVMQHGGRIFNEADTNSSFQVAAASAKFIGNGTAGSYSEKPVFIVGMMRSGTTLVEQVLSSHSCIGAAGEVRYWTKRAAPFCDANRPPNAAEAKELAEEYLKIIERSSPDTLKVTDKQPQNFFALGVILSVFPNAQIIHCKRNLVDTCLSIYMTPFRFGPDFGHSKANIVSFAKGYMRIMDRWRASIPSHQFLEVQYEDLVENQEASVQKLLDFLGVSFEDACLHHEKNTRSVSTPSLWQVRQPIYQSSVDRWKRYEPWLGEFRELVGVNT